MQRRPLKFLLSLLSLLFACAALLSGCAAFDEKQGEWIFQPSATNWGGMGPLDDTRDLWLDVESPRSGKPARLHALWMDAPAMTPVGMGPAAEPPVVLYLHGSRWNVSSSVFRARRLQEMGFDVLAIDYRGFGKSDFAPPTEANAYEDARAAWDWLAKQYPQRKRYIFGHSLGGAIAIELASQVHDEAGTIVEGTFTSIPDVVRSFKWGWLPVGPLITQRFDSVQKVARIGSPLLVVHGSADSLIQPTLGRQLYEAAAEPKAFVMVEGGTHHNTMGMGQAQYRAALTQLFGLPRNDSLRVGQSALPGGKAEQ